MLIVITGNGKGKTTSALGQALRACGDGKRVLMLEFIKGPWKSGEDKFLSNLQPLTSNFQIRKGGLGFVGILSDKLPREEHEKAAQKTLEEALSELHSGNWDMIILDEVSVALSLNLIKLEKVLEFCREAQEKKPARNATHSVAGGVDIILTGRDAPKELIAAADIVSEIREIKHVYNEGKKARKGIEY